MRAETTALVTTAHSMQELDPARVQSETNALMDSLDAIETALNRLGRLMDDVEVLASSGDEDPRVVGRVLLYRSKANALLRDARAVRVPLVKLRKGLVSFQLADRHVRATLKKAGEAVPDADLTQDDMDAAPDLRRVAP